MATSAHTAPTAFSRTKQLAVALGVGVLALSLPSCKGQPAQPSDGVCFGRADAGLTFDEFWNCLADAYCASEVDCGFAEPTFVAPCVARLTRYSSYPSIKASLAIGTVSYNSAAAPECLAGVRGAVASCQQAVPWSPACGKVLKPVLAEPGARCLPGFGYPFCSRETDVCVGPACQETCQSAGGPGQPCRLDGACNAGNYCNRATQTCAALLPAGSPCASNECDGSSYCDAYAHVCLPRRGEGEPCGRLAPPCAEGTSCLGSADAGACRPDAPVGGSCASTACAPTAYCDASRTCVARGESGSSCRSSAECASRLRCDSVSRTCETYRTVTQDGGVCTEDTLRCAYDSEYEAPPECAGVATNPDGGVGTLGACRWPQLGDVCLSSRGCPSASYCDRPDAGDSGVCRSVASGTPCDRRGECPAEQYCSSQGCQALGLRGGACTGAGQCAARLGCRVDPTDGGMTCGDLGAAGSPCRGSWGQCKEPNLCIDGVCTPAKTLGAPCASECLTGLCRPQVRDAGVLGTCEPYLVDGAPCFLDSECASMACESGVCVSACE